MVMTEAELAAIEARGTPSASCINCRSSLDVDPAEDEAACPVHGYCWLCMTRGRHGRECRQSCTDVPALIAEVRRLRKVLEVFRDEGLMECRFCATNGDLFCEYCDDDAERHAPVPDAVEHDPEYPCGIAQAALGGDTPPSPTISER